MTFDPETLFMTNGVAIVRITHNGVKTVYRFREGDTCIVTNAQGNKGNANHAGRKCIIESFPQSHSWMQKAEVKYLDTNRRGRQELYNLKPLETSAVDGGGIIDNVIEFKPRATSTES